MTSCSFLCGLHVSVVTIVVSRMWVIVEMWISVVWVRVAIMTLEFVSTLTGTVLFAVRLGMAVVMGLVVPVWIVMVIRPSYIRCLKKKANRQRERWRNYVKKWIKWNRHCKLKVNSTEQIILQWHLETSKPLLRCLLGSFQNSKLQNYFWSLYLPSYAWISSVSTSTV